MGVESIFGLEVNSSWAFLVDGFGGAVGVTTTVDVLRDQTFHVTCVSWDMLLSYFILWSTDPILAESTAVAVNYLLIGRFSRICFEVCQASLSCFIVHPCVELGEETLILDDLLFELASSDTKS